MMWLIVSTFLGSRQHDTASTTASVKLICGYSMQIKWSHGFLYLVRFALKHHTPSTMLFSAVSTFLWWEMLKTGENKSCSFFKGSYTNCCPPLTQFTFFPT